MIELLPRALYSQIDLDEWNEVEIPDGVEVYGIIEDGEIVAWYMKEQVVHCGPFWVDPTRRGGKLAGELMRHCSETVPHAYIPTLSPQTAKMCEKFGLVRVDGALYTR